MADVQAGSDYSAVAIVAVIDDKDYPGLYQSADTASLSAQKTYLVFQRMHLASLILGSIAGVFIAFATEETGPWFYSAIAIILALGVLVLWIIHSRKDDNVWFDCRAIAESTKTASWRFMMRAVPFKESDSADEKFIAQLREIREARPKSGQHLAGNIDPNAKVISDFMREMRARKFEERKSFYISSRLRDQKSWYSRKANSNSRCETNWFWVLTGLQGFAVVISIIGAASGGFQMNAVPILTTCAAAVVAWSQMKRHSELAQTYAIAAQELGELESIAVSLSSEADFLSVVEQVEETISREHTMWYARRDVAINTRSMESKHG